jgi:hypothetical protein
MLPFFLCIFGFMVIQTIYKHTDPISFVSAPSPFHFRSESTIKDIRFRICIRSLSAPLRIRRKNMVENMVKIKSNPIRSVYVPRGTPEQSDEPTYQSSQFTFVIINLPTVDKMGKQSWQADKDLQYDSYCRSVISFLFGLITRIWAKRRRTKLPIGA